MGIYAGCSFDVCVGLFTSVHPRRNTGGNEMISEDEKVSLILKLIKKDFKKPEGIRGLVWKLSMHLPDRIAEGEPMATFLCWILGPDLE